MRPHVTLCAKFRGGDGFWKEILGNDFEQIWRRIPDATKSYAEGFRMVGADLGKESARFAARSLMLCDDMQRYASVFFSRQKGGAPRR